MSTIRICPPNRRHAFNLGHNIPLTCGPASSAPAARPGTEEGCKELWIVCHYRDDWNADGLILGSAIDAIYIEPRVQLSAWPNPRNRELRISMTAYKLGNVNCKTISVLNSLWFSQNWTKNRWGIGIKKMVALIHENWESWLHVEKNHFPTNKKNWFPTNINNHFLGKNRSFRPYDSRLMGVGIEAAIIKTATHCLGCCWAAPRGPRWRWWPRWRRGRWTAGWWAPGRWGGFLNTFSLFHTTLQPNKGITKDKYREV